MNINLKDKLKLIPKQPGCYQYFDVNGEIIYVGKAKNLYNRVNSYFVGKQNNKTAKLVSQIHDVEYIITSSEIEAFILEINLIKKYDPKYNILLTDDKTYPYIVLTKEKHPKLIYTRDIKKVKGKVYGPYPNSKAAKDTVDLLNRIYPLRKCKNIPKKECLYYHIGQCLGPCIKTVDQELYQNIEKKISNILKGNVKEEIKNLEVFMNEASLKLDFEKAIQYRELIQSLNVISEKQKMEGLNQDLDAFAYYCDDEYISIQVFHLRNGKMIERNGYLLTKTDPLEQFQEFIIQFYLLHNNPFPKTIYLSDGDIELISEILEHRVQIPKIGQNLQLINLVKENAKQKINELKQKQENEYNKTTKVMEELSTLLNIENIQTIEAFDNSNINGASAVSAMVSFVDGKPNKKGYRKYRVKTVEGANDAATMYEIVTRRYSKITNYPDLIIMDGGAIQVNSCLNALKDINVNIPVCGLVKDDNHKTNNLLYNDEIIEINKSSNLFRLLTQIQDEVHRFAITYFHNTHSKNLFSSELDKIRGIGKVKKTKILKLLSEPNFEENLKTLRLTEIQIEEILKALKK